MVRQGAAARRGRAAGIAVFAILVSAFTLVCSIQIIRQVWFPETTPTDVECREGVIRLLQAVRRARRAAAAETGGEREALGRFREALQPEWSWRPVLTDRCSGDPEALRALGQIDRLRYAEEHAVRYETLDLAPRRRSVRSLEQDLRGGP